MTCVQPIGQAWLGSGATGAQNYDEFADESDITTILQRSPLSALGVEMAHWAPDRVSDAFSDNLGQAADRLAQAKQAGAYTPVRDVVGVYRIAEADGSAQALGLFAMVQTSQISTSADEPGQVIRNEDVFVAKVGERVELLKAIGHLLSPVLLIRTGDASALDAALSAVATSGVEPQVSDVDQAGRTHQVWAVTGDHAAELSRLAGDSELVVADGNHRSLAAQTAQLPLFLAVITTPNALRLDPYQRLFTTLDRPVEEILSALGAVGARVEESPADAEPTPGTVVFYAGGRAWAVSLPLPEGGSASVETVEKIDHSLLERALVTDLLGWDAGDKRIRYIGGDYPSSWLREQVDLGRAELAVLIAPVAIDDFVEVNQRRQKMPRKSTWFVPKARAGLVVAQL